MHAVTVVVDEQCASYCMFRGCRTGKKATLPAETKATNQLAGLRASLGLVVPSDGRVCVYVDESEEHERRQINGRCDENNLHSSSGEGLAADSRCCLTARAMIRWSPLFGEVVLLECRALFCGVRGRCAGCDIAKLGERVLSNLTSRSRAPVTNCSMCTQVWSRLVTDRGEMYYFNEVDKTISWTRPHKMGREREEGRLRVKLRFALRPPINLFFVVFGSYIMKDTTQCMALSRFRDATAQPPQRIQY